MEKNKTSTSKKAIKKTSTKKKFGKAFTLIELLAVIIILGILMIIAIPSVTTYIQNSRKNAYIDTAKNLASGTRNIVNQGKFGMYNTDTTYYIPSSCITTESGGESPYGKFTKAYIGVTYNGNGYNYYWISVDETGQGIKRITPVEKLEIDLIESNIDSNEIETIVNTTGIDERNKILILNDDCKNWNAEKIATAQVGSNGTGNNESQAASGNYVVNSTLMKIGNTIPNEVNLRNTAIEAMADWAIITGGGTLPYYLKYTLNGNNEIVESYIEFTITDELKTKLKNTYCRNDAICEAKYDNLVSGTYTLKGGDSGASYTENVNTIKKAFNVTKQPNICVNCNSTDCSRAYVCSVNGLRAAVGKSGSIKVDNWSSLYCSISEEGYSLCIDDPDW